MNITISRKITICMLFIALTFLGLFSYKQLKVELLPNAELPILFVRVSSDQDMSPAIIESEAIIPVEGAISSISGVDKISTTINSRYSNIQISFKNNVNFKIASLKLQEKMKETALNIPDNYKISVQKVNLDQMQNTLMTLKVTGAGGIDRVRNIIDEKVIKDIENIDGIAAAEIYGGREKAIEIQLDNDKCDALNLTPNKIANILNQNTQDKTFVGYIDHNNKNYFIHVSAPYSKVEDLKNIVVATGPIFLKDIANVYFGLKEETTYSRINGRDAITISLRNDSESNLIDLSHRTRKVIDKINNELKPYDVNISISEDTAEKMEKNINQIINLAILGGLLAMLILWFFLKNFKLVFFISLSIPISVFTAFNVFYAAGLTINSLSLMGIALAVGMLLDNSVVVLESIYRISSSGISPESAVIQGTKDVKRSIFAATLTTITVFLPFVFSDNYLIKMIGNNIGISIISTLIISLCVALLFVPMVSYQVLKSKKSRTVFESKVSIFSKPIQLYIVGLKTCMRHVGTVLISAIALFLIVLILALTSNTEKTQTIKSDSFNINITMPPSSSLENTDDLVTNLEKRLDKIEEKKEISSMIRDNMAVVTFKYDDKLIKDKKEIDKLRYRIEDITRDINTGDITVSDALSEENNSEESISGQSQFLRMMGIGNKNERIQVKGVDFDMMQIVAQDLASQLTQQDYIRYARVAYTPKQPEVIMNFSPELLKAYNISNSDITSSIANMNKERNSGTQFKVGDTNYDIIIRDKADTLEEKLNADKQKDDPSISELENQTIKSSQDNGGSYKLNNISSITKQGGRSKIIRKNQEKEVDLYYSFTPSILSSKKLVEGYQEDIDDMISNYKLPNNIALEIFHKEDDLKDFKFLILAAFILIFMILASVFESVFTPLVLMFSIPLAATGALLALFITGNGILTANTLTGFLILLGIVVNNGIILIDYAKILQKRGYNRNRALLTSGISRIRPILITTITTVVAMLPIALGKGEYSGVIGAPFAITVIGGLLFSALLTLFIVPTVYMGMDNFLTWYRNLEGKLKILHLIIALSLFTLIYFEVPVMGWKIAYMALVIILIPLITYFVQISLRTADKKIISDDDEINIVIRNLVKIYDWPQRVSREIEGGNKLNTDFGDNINFHKFKDFRNILWETFLLLFTIYLTYFSINAKFWIFILSFCIYFMTKYIFSKIFIFWQYKVKNTEKKKFKKIKRVLQVKNIFYWLLPIIILTILASKLSNISLIIIVTIIWFFFLIVKKTSNYIYKNNINVKRVTGKHSKRKAFWYNLVLNIPIIGKRKKPFKALHGVSLEIKTGMFGLLGPNGAGKSTMMKILCGILEPSYGSIFVNGLDTRKYREELQSTIGYLPQEFGTYENMTAWDFLDYQALLKDISDTKIRHERLEYVLKATNMYERKDDKINAFSGGMKQRIGIALILLHLPKILIVDEPTAGLDPKERIRFRNLLVELSKNRIVIFSTHIIEDIASSCNQVAIINHGELKYYGNPTNMVSFAENKVWTITISKEDFDKYLDLSKIVNHVPMEDYIKVRYLSSEKPYETAILAEPNLEDAYLCMQKNL